MRHLLFDVLSTVVYAPFHEVLPQFFGMSFEELLEATHPTAWREFEKGHTTEDEFLTSFFADGRDYDHQGLIRSFRSTYRYLEGMDELLAELAERAEADGYRMHYFSNYPVWYRWIEEQLELSRHAPWTFVSCHMGLRKPSPEAFQHVLDTLGADSRDCVLIDDLDRNTRAAEEQGLKAIRFRDARALRQSLRDHGFPA